MSNYDNSNSNDLPPGYERGGSIWDVAAAQGITVDERSYTGGIHSGRSHEEAIADAMPNQPNRSVSAGGAPNMGGWSATTPSGDPIVRTVDIQPDSIVTVQTPHGPMTTDYATALQVGLLSANAQLAGGGNGDDGRDGRRQQPPQDQQDQQDEDNKGDMDKAEDAVPMDAQAEALMRDALARDDGAVVQAASDLIETGVVGDDMIARLAAPGENPEQVNAKVQTAIEGYRGDAVRGAARHSGTDETLAYEALMANAGSPAMKRAMHEHVQRGGTRQYASFVRDHVASIAETAPQRILTAEVASGISVREDGGGEIIVTIDGKSFRWQDAVQQGLIRVSSGRRR